MTEWERIISEEDNSIQQQTSDPDNEVLPGDFFLEQIWEIEGWSSIKETTISHNVSTSTFANFTIQLTQKSPACFLFHTILTNCPIRDQYFCTLQYFVLNKKSSKNASKIVSHNFTPIKPFADTRVSIRKMKFDEENGFINADDKLSIKIVFSRNAEIIPRSKTPSFPPTRNPSPPSITSFPETLPTTTTTTTTTATSSTTAMTSIPSTTEKTVKKSKKNVKKTVDINDDDDDNYDDEYTDDDNVVETKKKQSNSPKWSSSLNRSRRYFRVSDDFDDDLADISDKYCGIRNQGATCYVNSVLQTLFHLPLFRKIIYQVDCKRLSDEYEKTILWNLQRLFAQMQTKTEPVSTKLLTKSFGWNDEILFYQQDIQEFLCVLLEKIEDKLNNTPQKEEIEVLFSGIQTSLIRCIDVDYSTRNNENFTVISLNVEDCDSLSDSLKMYIKPEHLENKYSTGTEYGLQDALKMYEFTKLPSVLFLHLRRFEFQNGRKMKINSRFSFPIELDMKEFMSSEAENVEHTEYELFGVHVHAGEAEKGHFYAFLRTSINENCQENIWYQFNDSEVTLSNDFSAIDDNFGGSEDQEGSQYSAYMLVYIQRDEIPNIFSPISTSLIPKSALSDVADIKILENVVTIEIYTDKNIDSQSLSFSDPFKMDIKRNSNLVDLNEKVSKFLGVDYLNLYYFYNSKILGKVRYDDSKTLNSLALSSFFAEPIETLRIPKIIKEKNEMKEKKYKLYKKNKNDKNEMKDVKNKDNSNKNIEDIKSDNETGIDARKYSDNNSECNTNIKNDYYDDNNLIKNKDSNTDDNKNSKDNKDNKKDKKGKNNKKGRNDKKGKNNDNENDANNYNKKTENDENKNYNENNEDENKNDESDDSDNEKGFNSGKNSKNHKDIINSVHHDLQSNNILLFIEFFSPEFHPFLIKFIKSASITRDAKICSLIPIIEKEVKMPNSKQGFSYIAYIQLSLCELKEIDLFKSSNDLMIDDGTFIIFQLIPQNKQPQCGSKNIKIGLETRYIDMCPEETPKLADEYFKMYNDSVSFNMVYPKKNIEKVELPVFFGLDKLKKFVMRLFKIDTKSKKMRLCMYKNNAVKPLNEAEFKSIGKMIHNNDQIMLWSSVAKSNQVLRVIVSISKDAYKSDDTRMRTFVEGSTVEDLIKYVISSNKEFKKNYQVTDFRALLLKKGKISKILENNMILESLSNPMRVELIPEDQKTLEEGQFLAKVESVTRTNGDDVIPIDFPFLLKIIPNEKFSETKKRIFQKIKVTSFEIQQQIQFVFDDEDETKEDGREGNPTNGNESGDDNNDYEDDDEIKDDSVLSKIANENSHIVAIFPAKAVTQQQKRDDGVKLYN